MQINPPMHITCPYQLLPVHDYHPQGDSNEPSNTTFLVGELPGGGTPRVALQPGEFQAMGYFMEHSHSPHVGYNQEQTHQVSRCNRNKALSNIPPPTNTFCVVLEKTRDPTLFFFF